MSDTEAQPVRVSYALSTPGHEPIIGAVTAAWSFIAEHPELVIETVSITLADRRWRVELEGPPV